MRNELGYIFGFKIYGLHLQKCFSPRLITDRLTGMKTRPQLHAFGLQSHSGETDPISLRAKSR